MKILNLKFFIVTGVVVLALLVFTFINMGLIKQPFGSDNTNTDTATATSTTPTNNLLQFTLANHALGFSNDGVFIASATHMLKVSFVNSNNVTPTSESSSSTTAITTDKATPLDKVTYKNVWNGIDVIYESQNGSLMKSTYYVGINPSADSGQAISTNNIKLKYNRPVSLDKNNNLVIKYDTGIMTESAPIAWQEINNTKVPVEVNYKIINEQNNEVGFTVGNYNKDYSLIIDPTYDWLSFLGGTGSDQCLGVALDISGNMYVTGRSDSTWGQPIREYTLNVDVFVAKIDSSGALIWSTFLGGTGGDYGKAIGVDTGGNVYVTGYSSVTWGSPIRLKSTSNDAFAAKLTTSGTLLWNTFLGGTGSDQATSIAVDTSGNVYVGGHSPVTWGLPVQAHTTGNNDAFAVKLDDSGAITWSTFLGGDTGNDYGNSIVVDTSGNVYVAGYSEETWGSPVREYSPAGLEVFVAKLTSAGAITWNTFLGGEGDEIAYSISVDTSGNAYVAGQGSLTWGSPIEAYIQDSFAVFVVKIDSLGSLTWNTFLGGTGSNVGNSITVDAIGNVYVGGKSNTTWESPLRVYVLDYDAFAAKLTTSGTLLWNTFLGGTGGDQATSIAVDTSGNVYVGGYSSATWGSPVRDYTLSNDAFATKLTSLGALVTFSTSHTITASLDSNGTITPSEAVTVEDSTNQTFTITPNTSYKVSDVLVDGVSQGAISSYTFTNVTTDHTISVVFELATSSSGSGGGRLQTPAPLTIPTITSTSTTTPTTISAQVSAQISEIKQQLIPLITKVIQLLTLQIRGAG